VVPDDEDSLRFEVPWSKSLGSRWHGLFAGNGESAYIGLPEEYTGAVLDGFGCAAMGNLSPGVVRVSDAAHGLIGSSPNFMARLARAAIEITMLHEPSDAAVADLLTRILLGTG
jgi:hypothetical protein